MTVEKLKVCSLRILSSWRLDIMLLHLDKSCISPQDSQQDHLTDYVLILYSWS